MKKKAAIALLAAVGISLAVPLAAHRFDRRADDQPLRLVGYALHPVGIALEYGVMRPVHWLVSRPHLDIVFGHKASLKDDGTYFEWIHGDYEPSIAVERAAMMEQKNPKPMKAEGEMAKEENGRERPKSDKE